MDKKKLRIYLEIMTNLLMIIRNKDVLIHKLEMELRESRQLQGKKGNVFH